MSAAQCERRRRFLPAAMSLLPAHLPRSTRWREVDRFRLRWSWKSRRLSHQRARKIRGLPDRHDFRTEAPTGLKARRWAIPRANYIPFRFRRLLSTSTKAKLFFAWKSLRSPALLGRTAPCPEARYQACSREVCLPPTTLDVDAVVAVASADTGTPFASRVSNRNTEASNLHVCIILLK